MTDLEKFQSLAQMTSSNNKVKTREELLLDLKTYRGLLADSIINYLNSLIELEFSVVKDYISDEERKRLSTLEIYHEIAIYNIYNRALNIFQNQDQDLNFTFQRYNDKLNINANFIDQNIRLFTFNYQNNQNILSKSLFSQQFKKLIEKENEKVGEIILYQTLENKELREIELDMVMENLERLYDDVNPFLEQPDVLSGLSSTWFFEHLRQVDYYEKKFEELDNKKELSETEKREIEVTNHIRHLFLEDYGLSNKDFKVENNNSFLKQGTNKTNLQKTLVKRTPSLKITTKVRYI